jgi:uncharacterized protein (DUF1499 family)
MNNTLFSPRVLQISALIFFLGSMAAPLASKFDLWHFASAFTALRGLFVLGATVFILSMYFMLESGIKQGKPYTPAVLLSFLPLAMMLYQVVQVSSLPHIHDISTDTDNPPVFFKAQALRKQDDHSTLYLGQAIAAQQHAAYPDIKPVISKLKPALAFVQILASLRTQGLNIVAQDPDKGHIEATGSSFWFGFTDDVVIRVSAANAGSRIDIRSASRVGKSDIGKNAQRIRGIIKTFKEQS